MSMMSKLGPPTSNSRRQALRWRTLSLAILLLAFIVFLTLGDLWLQGTTLGHLLLDVTVSVMTVLLTIFLLCEVARARRSEEEMAKHVSLLTTALDFNSALIWVKDDGAQYVIVNDAMAQLRGVGKEDFIGRTSVDIMPPDESKNIIEWDRTAFANPGFIVAGEQIVSRSGELTYWLNYRQVCNIDGRLMLVGSAMDVTPLRRAEQELRSEMQQRETAEAELRQAQKMEAIGRLTGGIAHDFNNLLTSVLGNIDLAKAQLPDGRARIMLDKATHAAERGAKLIEQLLAFARKQNLQARPIDLNLLVRGMKDLLHHSIDATIRVETILEDPIWPAFCDANQVEAALLNIAINARDAMPAGGKLTIRTANIESADSRRPSALPRSNYVVITVTDTGTGMSDDVLAKAFDPFFTTKEFGKGSGLGLSQVYGMAQQSGGTATITSTPGKGTSVSLFLPCAIGSDPNDSQIARGFQPHGRETARVAAEKS
jgi:PAS domain S-box-containing protein